MRKIVRSRKCQNMRSAIKCIFRQALFISIYIVKQIIIQAKFLGNPSENEEEPLNKESDGTNTESDETVMTV